MSVTKTKATQFHTTEQDVKFKMEYIRLDGLSEAGFPSLTAGAGFAGRIADTTGDVETFNAPKMGREDILSGLSATEKTAGKKFLAAMEREFAKKVEELKDETHDDTDVFA